MAINGLTFASSFALKLTLSISVFGTAIYADDGSYDYVNSRQFHKNLAVSKYKNNTFWLTDFQWKPPKISTKPRKRPKWESSDNVDDKVEKKISEWEKQMQEISRKEREKWKKYQAGKSKSLLNFDKQTNLVKNMDEVKRNGTTKKKLKKKNDQNFRVGSEAKGTTTNVKKIELKLNSTEEKGKSFYDEGDQFKTFIEILKDKSKDNNSFPELVKKLKKLKKAEENSTEKSNKIIPKHTNLDAKFFYQENGKIIEPWKNDFDNKNAEIVNGRWGMSGGNRPPLDMQEKIFEIKMIEKNNEDEKRRKLLKNGEEFLEEKKLSMKDIWKGRWGLSESEPPENFLKDISTDKIATQESEKLKLDDHRTTGRRNFISKLKPEHWIHNQQKIQDHIFKNNQWGLNKLETLSKPRKNLPHFVLSNNERCREIDSPSGVWKFIKIILPPYAAAAANAASASDGMELSMDRVIPESNGISGLMKLQPIVIELSTRDCEKCT